MQLEPKAVAVTWVPPTALHTAAGGAGGGHEGGGARAATVPALWAEHHARRPGLAPSSACSRAARGPSRLGRLLRAGPAL